MMYFPEVISGYFSVIMSVMAGFLFFFPPSLSGIHRENILQSKLDEHLADGNVRIFFKDNLGLVLVSNYEVPVSQGSDCFSVKLGNQLLVVPSTNRLNSTLFQSKI